MENETKALRTKQRPTIDFKFTLEEMDEDVGTFSGYASVWGVTDSYGDVVMKGAFNRTIKNRKGKGFPMLWSHKVDEPIGLIHPVEDEKGLKVRGEFNMDDPLAVRIRSHMKQGSVTGLSIGYQTVVEELDKENGTRKLKEIRLWEISPVVFPACEPAQVDGVKGEPAHLDRCVNEEGEWVYDEDCPACRAMINMELKPYPSEHACRLKDPDGFQDGSFRRVTRNHEGKEYSVIMGKLKGDDGMTEQAYRYGKDTWSVDEARAHCKGHSGISFEPASGKCAECSAMLDPDPAKATPADDSARRHSFVINERARLLKHYLIWRS